MHRAVPGSDITKNFLQPIKTSARNWKTNWKICHTKNWNRATSYIMAKKSSCFQKNQNIWAYLLYIHNAPQLNFKQMIYWRFLSYLPGSILHLLVTVPNIDYTLGTL